MFVVPAYFAARNMAILADYACYHWVRWDSDENASYAAAGPGGVLRRRPRACSTSSTPTPSPASSATALYGRWYRGKLLGRLGRNAFLGPRRGAPPRRAGRRPRADRGALPASGSTRRWRPRCGCARRSRGATTTTASSRWRSTGATSLDRARAARTRRRDLDDARAGVLAARARRRAAARAPPRRPPPARAARRASPAISRTPSSTSPTRSGTPARSCCSSRRARRPTGSSRSRSTVDVPEAADDEPVRVTAIVRRRGSRRRSRPAGPRRSSRATTTCARSSGSPASPRTRSCSTGASRASSRSTPEERIFVAGEVPEPPERTPRERLRFGLGRLRLRARGPRAAA